MTLDTVVLDTTKTCTESVLCEFIFGDSQACYMTDKAGQNDCVVGG